RRASVAAGLAPIKPRVGEKDGDTAGGEGEERKRIDPMCDSNQRCMAGRLDGVGRIDRKGSHLCPTISPEALPKKARTLQGAVMTAPCSFTAGMRKSHSRSKLRQLERRSTAPVCKSTAGPRQPRLAPAMDARRQL